MSCPTCLAATSLLSGALIALATATLSPPAHAAPGRYSMEQCVDRVLSRLARAGADEAQVGPTVLSQCDGPLRAALADAIQSGEAPLCTVESCMGMPGAEPVTRPPQNTDSASDAAECGRAPREPLRHAEIELTQEPGRLASGSAPARCGCLLRAASARDHRAPCPFAPRVPEG